jgi:hypothetical protein
MEPLEGRSLLSGVVPTGVDQPPVLAAVGTRWVEEGSAVDLQAAATDPNPGHTIMFSLDSGAPSGATIDPASGQFHWTPPNVQTIYTLTIRATDSGPQSLSAATTLTVMVFDVPPTISAGINATIAPGTEFVRTGSFADPNPDTWTGTVDYGDGLGPEPLALGPDKTFTLDHTYAKPGSYVVGVTIIDSQGGQGHAYFALSVGVSPASSDLASATPWATPTSGGTSQDPATWIPGTVTAQTAPAAGSQATSGSGGLQGANVKHPHPHPHPHPHSHPRPHQHVRELIVAGHAPH